MPLLAGEAGVEEGVNQLASQLDANHSAAEHEHVHVVVFDALVRRVGVVAEAGADARHLVRRHRHADAAAAQNDAALRASSTDRLTNRRGEVRIVHRLRAVGAHVEHVAVLGDEEALDRLLQLEARMIAANRDAHSSPRTRDL